MVTDDRRFIVNDVDPTQVLPGAMGEDPVGVAHGGTSRRATLGPRRQASARQARAADARWPERDRGASPPRTFAPRLVAGHLSDAGPSAVRSSRLRPGPPGRADTSRTVVAPLPLGDVAAALQASYGAMRSRTRARLPCAGSRIHVGGPTAATAERFRRRRSRIFGPAHRLDHSARAPLIAPRRIEAPPKGLAPSRRAALTPRPRRL